jgi:hypothetical protein
VKTTSVLILALSALVLLPGCPDTGIVCAAGTIRCGQGCVDATSDEKNCGACGSSCRSGQVCSSSACKCSEGTSACDGECVVLASDPKNCGACGSTSALARCDPGNVCEMGVCKISCTLTATSTLCGGACVNLNTDAMNCGACGGVCSNAQSCHNGKCTYDLVAACFGSGQVRGIQRPSENLGPVQSLGTAPQSLATFGANHLLSLDGIDQRLYQALLTSTDAGSALSKLPNSTRTGNAPNQVIVDGQFVYIANSGSGTVQVLRNGGTLLDGGVPPADAGLVADGGLALVTIAEVQLGTNTYPQGIAKVGTNLWVPLYGGFGAAGSAPGQKVARIDVTNPAGPLVVSELIDLTGLNLKAFDGGMPVPRPYAILAHDNAVYVALNNLNADTYVPEGPGLLAKINPTTKAVTVIDLGADKCLNPGWLASDGTNLLVSCIGAAEYSGPPDYALVRTAKSGIVLLQNDERKGTWEPACPAGADGGSGCTPILPSRFAISNGRAYVGDQNGGRIFVLDIGNNGTLTERRGYFGDAGAAIAACAPDAITGIANVSDVLAVP